MRITDKQRDLIKLVEKENSFVFENGKFPGNYLIWTNDWERQNIKLNKATTESLIIKGILQFKRELVGEIWRLNPDYKNLISNL